MRNEITPPEPALAGGCSEGAKNGTRGLDKRISRYSQLKRIAKDHASYIASLLKKNNHLQKHHREALLKIVSKLDNCGIFLWFRHYFQLDIVRLVKIHTCQSYLLCPLCAARRATVYHREYSRRLIHLRSEDLSLRFSTLTLTIEHTNKDSLDNVFTRLKYYLKLAQQRIRNTHRGISSSEFGKILGYVGAFEVTYGKNGWHPHLHIMVLHREKLSESAIRNEWTDITGNSTQIRVNSCANQDDPSKDFLEVFKYALKFSKLTRERLVQCYLYFKGKRMIFSGGLFRGVNVPDDLSDEIIKDEPYLELIYKYLDLSREYAIYTNPVVVHPC